MMVASEGPWRALVAGMLAGRVLRRCIPIPAAARYGGAPPTSSKPQSLLADKDTRRESNRTPISRGLKTEDRAWRARDVLAVFVQGLTNTARHLVSKKVKGTAYTSTRTPHPPQNHRQPR